MPLAPTHSNPPPDRHNFLPWLFTSGASLIALGVWLRSYGGQLSEVSSYQIFPLLGILGFSIMWSHYIAGFLKRTMLPDAQLATYFRITGYAVLVTIVLHPGLLIFQRFIDGYGLPPASYKTYVAPSMAWLTLLGSASLLVFLAYEAHRWFKDRSWWKYVILLGDFAMLAVFYHGLQLGSQTRIGWFRVIWLFYGLTLLGCILFKYFHLLRQRRSSQHKTAAAP